MTEYSTLAMVSPGQRVQVVEVAANRRVAHRLAQLGITRGVGLEVLNRGGGPLRVAVRDTRLGLERGLAHMILVQPESGVLRA